MYVALFGNNDPVVVSSGMATFNEPNSERSSLDYLHGSMNHHGDVIKRNSDRLVQEVIKRLQTMVADEKGQRNQQKQQSKNEREQLLEEQLTAVDNEDLQLTSNARMKHKTENNANKGKRKRGTLTMKQRRWLFIAEFLERVIFITYIFVATFTPICLFFIFPHASYKGDIHLEKAGKLYFHENVK